MKFQVVKNKDFLSFILSGVVFILLINVKMSTILHL